MELWSVSNCICYYLTFLFDSAKTSAPVDLQLQSRISSKVATHFLYLFLHVQKVSLLLLLLIYKSFKNVFLLLCYCSVSHRNWKKWKRFYFYPIISHSPHANELIHTKVLFTHSYTHRYYILTQYALDFNPSLLYNVSKPLALLPRRPPITQRHHDALLL